MKKNETPEELLKSFADAGPDDLIGKREAAIGIGVKITLLESKISRGGGPMYQKIGKHVCYRKQDVLDWYEKYKNEKKSRSYYIQTATIRYY